MRIGVLRVIKTDMYRVALTSPVTGEPTSQGHADPALVRGINVVERRVANLRVAAATGNLCYPPESLLPFDHI